MKTHRKPTAPKAATLDSSRSSTPSSPLQSNNVPGFNDSKRKAPKPKNTVDVLWAHGLVKFVSKVFSEMGKTNALRGLALLEDYEISKLRLKSSEADGLQGICDLIAQVRGLEPTIIAWLRDSKRALSRSSKDRLKSTLNRLKQLELRIAELYQDPLFRRRFRTFAPEKVITFSEAAATKANAIPSQKPAKFGSKSKGGEPDAIKLVRKAAYQTAKAEDPLHLYEPKLKQMYVDMKETLSANAKAST